MATKIQKYPYSSNTLVQPQFGELVAGSIQQRWVPTTLWLAVKVALTSELPSPPLGQGL